MYCRMYKNEDTHFIDANLSESSSMGVVLIGEDGDIFDDGSDYNPVLSYSFKLNTVLGKVEYSDSCHDFIKTLINDVANGVFKEYRIPCSGLFGSCEKKVFFEILENLLGMECVENNGQYAWYRSSKGLDVKTIKKLYSFDEIYKYLCIPQIKEVDFLDALF